MIAATILIDDDTTWWAWLTVQHLSEIGKSLSTTYEQADQVLLYVIDQSLA